eukprot:TRINITY_DN31996_c0_g1_i1.p1 TRINITY_DN31996_c0_g1~~TRINITY_DN31996_c0_g1_i1.p1  ORF type:complete len:354 (-),score=45.31 TRINITY_DN31996_c0_g1_i1:291-1352(-)
MNKARAMLDALMGPDRDAANTDTKKSKEKFKDSNVCKYYLLGLCPHDQAFLGGKRKYPVCQKLHSDTMKQLFESHPDVEEYRREYELRLLADLEYIVRECDGKVSDEKARIRDDWGLKRPPLPPAIIDKLSMLKRGSATLVAQAEALDDDKFQEKAQLTAKANEMLLDCQQLEDAETKKALEATGTEDVCPVCGTTYKGKAGETAHLQFKIHGAFEQIRAKLTELKEKVKNAPPKKKRDEKDEEAKPKKEEKDKPDQDKSNGKEKERSKDNDRERESKDRGASGARGKSRKQDSRSRDRGKGRARARDDSRDRSRTRGKEASRKKGRRCSRSRSRSNDSRQSYRGRRGRNGRR